MKQISFPRGTDRARATGEALDKYVQARRR
jgi:hypothetical protein